MNGHVKGLFVERSELVNENETSPTTIYCSTGSLFGNAGLLIQTAGGSNASVGGFPLNRFGYLSHAISTTDL